MWAWTGVHQKWLLHWLTWEDNFMWTQTIELCNYYRLILYLNSNPVGYKGEERHVLSVAAGAIRLWNP